MRNKLLAIVAIAGAIGAPIAAQAQGVVTTGVVRGGPVIINDDEGIAVDQRRAFREYIVRERVPNYSIPDRVIVGGVLPETGVTYYDVPQTFGVTPYRYTVVNGRTVLVEPRSRRIVQVVEEARPRHSCPNRRSGKPDKKAPPGRPRRAGLFGFRRPCESRTRRLRLLPSPA